jgi:hypothetical protein
VHVWAVLPTKKKRESIVCAYEQLVSEAPITACMSTVSIDDSPSARKNTMWGWLIDAVAVAMTATRSPQDTIAEPNQRRLTDSLLFFYDSAIFRNLTSGSVVFVATLFEGTRQALASQVALAQHGAALHGVGAGDVDVGGCCEWCPQELL